MFMENSDYTYTEISSYKNELYKTRHTEHKAVLFFSITKLQDVKLFCQISIKVCKCFLSIFLLTLL